MNSVESEDTLAALALALIPPSEKLTQQERRLLPAESDIDPILVARIREQIKAGTDPLGATFCRLRSPAERRAKGATYTPPTIVNAMVQWAVGQNIKPMRVIDPGSGSGRFIMEAAKAFPEALLVAVEIDPLATLLLRANAAVLGFASRLQIKLTDYRRLTLPKVGGPTLFIGNPPYVRHHEISNTWKKWFAETASAYDLSASKLSGLHIHFFLKTRQLSNKGDFGAFITAAEWIDVNYGDVLRKLLANGLGGTALHVLDARTQPFADALTTGAITCFTIGARPDNLAVRHVETLDGFNLSDQAEQVPWRSLEAAPRWSMLIRKTPPPEAGWIELGELFRVSRGQVTGGNNVWIAGPHARGLPDRYLVPTITKARELIAAGPVLSSCADLKRVIDLPPDLNAMSGAERKAVKAFLEWAKQQGAHQTYVALHRRSWWSVSLYEAAPILCTYMARRAPAFVRNQCQARHINIAHGLYPREQMSTATLDALCRFLRENVGREGGRTYAGGLTKFEPREVERLHIPRPEQIEAA
jgi:hypothetical protein